MDIDIRSSGNAENRRPPVSKPDKLLAVIGTVIGCGNGIISDAVSKLDIDGSEDPSPEAAEMRLEKHLLPEMVADLRTVAVAEHAVGSEAHLAEAVGHGRLAA